jgi:hypothetical protein
MKLKVSNEIVACEWNYRRFEIGFKLRSNPMKSSLLLELFLKIV